MNTTFSAFLISMIVSLYFMQPANHQPLQKRTFYKAENKREAYDALTFLTAMNSFPAADIPKDGYARAWKKHLEIMAKPNPSTRNAWQSIGPNNIGGRTVSIAIDPVDTSIVWLGSASGGLWKSATGGIGINAWEYIPTGFPVLGIGSIAINPDNHNEIFIGTGETYAYGISTNGLVDRTQRGSFGIGILKTSDGGTTWSHVLDWSYESNRGVWDVVFNPSNPSTLYAATTEGIYKSPDGGTTWTLSLDRKMVMDLAIDPIDTATVFAGVGNEESADKGIYRTTDGGANWSLLTNGLPANTHDGRIIISMAANDHNTLMAIIANRYSTVGTYRTSDGGDSWSLKSSTDIMEWQGWYSKGLLMKSNDNTKVLAGGVDIFKSNSSGSSMFQVSNVNWYSDYVHSDIHDIISSPADPNKVYIITDAGLFRSNDFGVTFYECTDGYVTSQHYIGSVSQQNPNLMLSGLQDNYTNMYTGSSYWTSVLGGDGTYNAINPINDAVEFAAYQYLNIYKTYDYFSYGSTYGVYFSPGNAEGGNPAAFLAPFLISPSNPDVMYAGSSTLIKSDNAGDFWYEVQPDPIDNENPVLSIAVSSLDPDTVYFATAPSTAFPMHVYRSFDGGNSKTDITPGLPNRYPRRITVNPHNAQEVYVVFSGFNGAPGGHVFKSEDAGSSWIDISMGLPDMPFHCLTIDPDYPNNFYLGCDYAIYASINGGVDWFTYNDGLPQALMVFDLVISPSDNSLLAFTHGNGVYRNQLLQQGVGTVPFNSSDQPTVYPNPASDHIVIDLHKEVKNGFLRLLDVSGQVVLEKEFSVSPQITVNLSNLPSGLYVLNLNHDHFEYTTKLVVVH